MAKIGAIVVLYNWNGRTLQNINSYSKYFDETILIDNSDKKKNNIKLRSCIYENMNGNFGIGYAINRGIEIAKKHGMDFVVTLDQDSKYKDNTATYYKMVAADLDVDSTIIVPRNYVKNLRKDRNADEQSPNLLVQSGAMFGLKIFEKTGYFNEDLFIDVVDYEFGIRAKAKNCKILRCNNIVLNHRPGASKVRKVFGREIKYVTHAPVRIYYQSRNLLWTAKKYKNKQMLKIYLKLPLKILLLFDNKGKNMQMFVRGTRDAFRNILGKADL